jgi:hypothetical protein
MVQVGVDCVKEANAEQLHRGFNDTIFKPDESVWRILLYKERILDDDITDKEVIKKLLHIIPGEARESCDLN